MRFNRSLIQRTENYFKLKKNYLISGENQLKEEGEQTFLKTKKKKNYSIS